MVPAVPWAAMRYQVVVEYDPSTRHYTATVAGIPAIVVDAKSQQGVVRLAKEAIQFYLDEQGKRPRRSRTHKPVRAKLVTVQV